jgi:hypothetical protein
MLNKLFIILFVPCFVLFGSCFEKFCFGQRLIPNDSSQVSNPELNNKVWIRFALSKIPLDYVEVIYANGKIYKVYEFDHTARLFACEPSKVVWSLQNKLYSIDLTKGVEGVVIKGSTAQLRPDLFTRRRQNKVPR